jgi:hypothetical protein
MIEDLSGGDDDDGKPPVGPALMLGAKMGDNELRMYEFMIRSGSRQFPGSADVMFTFLTDDGDAIWDPPVPPDFVDEAKRWQDLMSWPTVPTIEEARAFQTNARAALLAAWWDRLAAARAEDDAVRPAGMR